MLTEKKFSLQKRALPEETAIQITSLADIFIIVLIFLIKSYSSTSMKITIPKGINIPFSSIEANEPTGLKVEVSEDSITMDNVIIQKLSHYTLSYEKNFINRNLVNAFSQYRKKQEAIAKKNPSILTNKTLILIADQKTPYETLKSILASAGEQGLSDIQLVVGRKD
jgi:biopolymer transport protein ExbD